MATSSVTHGYLCDTSPFPRVPSDTINVIQFVLRHLFALQRYVSFTVRLRTWSKGSLAIFEFAGNSTSMKLDATIHSLILASLFADPASYWSAVQRGNED